MWASKSIAIIQYPYLCTFVVKNFCVVKIPSPFMCHIMNMFFCSIFYFCV